MLFRVFLLILLKKRRPIKIYHNGNLHSFTLQQFKKYREKYGLKLHLNMSEALNTYTD